MLSLVPWWWSVVWRDEGDSRWVDFLLPYSSSSSVSCAPRPLPAHPPCFFPLSLSEQPDRAKSLTITVFGSLHTPAKFPTPGRIPLCRSVHFPFRMCHSYVGDLELSARWIESPGLDIGHQQNPFRVRIYVLESVVRRPMQGEIEAKDVTYTINQDLFESYVSIYVATEYNG